MIVRWLWWLGAAALAACLLPWVSNPGAGLNLNPVDLAEWTSLNPAVQAQTPALFTAFLLRTPLLIVAVLFGLAAGRSNRLIAAILILLLAAAQLPPFEFLSDSANANYRQQALLAALTLALGLAALLVVPRRRTLAVAAVTGALGLAAALLGAASALSAMQTFGLPALPGPGLILYAAVMGLAIALPLVNDRIKKRRTVTPPSVVL